MLLFSGAHVLRQAAETHAQKSTRTGKSRELKAIGREEKETHRQKEKDVLHDHLCYYSYSTSTSGSIFLQKNPEILRVSLFSRDRSHLPGEVLASKKLLPGEKPGINASEGKSCNR